MPSKKTGEYQGQPSSPDTVKKKVVFQGMDVHLDRPRGFIMRGEDDKGTPWERRYKVDYGFIPNTKGGDGDGVDVFLGPDKTADEAYWIAQKKPDGTFDEYKVMLGFTNRDTAIGCFRDHIPLKLLGGVTVMKTDMMKAMLGLEPAPNFGMKVAFAGELHSLQGDVRCYTERLFTGPLLRC